MNNEEILIVLNDIDLVMKDMRIRRTYIPFRLECAQRRLLKLTLEA